MHITTIVRASCSLCLCSAAALLLTGAPVHAGGCQPSLPAPPQPSVSHEILEIDSFAPVVYLSGFSADVGATAAWPAEMGWQGDTIDIGFTVPALDPDATHFTVAVDIDAQFAQVFDLVIEAGPNTGDLQEVTRQTVTDPTVIAGYFPICRLTSGQPAVLRLRGDGASTGFGQPAGLQFEAIRLFQSEPTTVEAMRESQLRRLTRFALDSVADSGLVRDGLPLRPTGGAGFPATPDAAGFVLATLAGAEHAGVLDSTTAQDTIERILRAYAGLTPGVNPVRSTNGFWIHFMDPATGGFPGGGWDTAYAPISAALFVSGAMIASNHFPQNAAIDQLAHDLYNSVAFDDAIQAGSGRIYLSVGANGTGDTTNFGLLSNWNEYALVVSLALRQADHDAAETHRDLWLDAATVPTASFLGLEMPAQAPGVFAPAFWVHQSHFFSPDLSFDPAWETFFENHRLADRAFCTQNLGQTYRYGLTAGPSPSGYEVASIFGTQQVFSPSAVGAWGDTGRLLDYLANQPAEASITSRYGLLREWSLDPMWRPNTVASVDHGFLGLGLIESFDPMFFKDRLDFGAPPCATDLNNDGEIGILDLLEYLVLWFALDDDAEVSGSEPSQITILDLLTYLSRWFTNACE